jgi:hypothetical protein
MRTIKLSLASPGKYGLVTVKSDAQTIEREYRITADELRALHASVNDAPPGLTQQKWNEGFCYVAGKDHDVGDCDVQNGEFLRVMYHEEMVAGRIISEFAIFGKGEWSGDAPNVSVTVEAIRELADAAAEAGKTVVITRIENGEMTVESI